MYPQPITCFFLQLVFQCTLYCMCWLSISFLTGFVYNYLICIICRNEYLLSRSLTGWNLHSLSIHHPMMLQSTPSHCVDTQAFPWDSCNPYKSDVSIALSCSCFSCFRITRRNCSHSNWIRKIWRMFFIWRKKVSEHHMAEKGLDPSQSI